MESVKHAGRKGIAGAGRTLAVAGREFQRALLEAEAFGGGADSAKLRVDSDGLFHAEREQLFRRPNQPARILRINEIADGESRFEFVDDEVIGQRQGTERNLPELGVGGADHVDRGLEPSRAGIEEQLGRNGLAAFKGIQAIEQHEVTKVEDAGLGLTKGAMFKVEMGIGAAAMEERPSTRRLHRHGIGVGGRVLGAEVEHGDINPVILAIALDPASVVIVAHEPASR